MARRKIPENEKLKTVGVNLPDATIDRLESLSLELDLKTSVVIRELLMLGLAVIDAAGNNRLLRLRFETEPPDNPDLQIVSGGKG